MDVQCRCVECGMHGLGQFRGRAVVHRRGPGAPNVSKSSPSCRDDRSSRPAATWSARSRFFSDKGDFNAEIALPEPRSLEERETTLDEDPEDREMFLRLMRKMIQWDPAKHSSPKELAEDEWIRKHS